MKTEQQIYNEAYNHGLDHACVLAAIISEAMDSPITNMFMIEFARIIIELKEVQALPIKFDAQAN